MIQSPAGYQGDVRIKRYLDFYQAGYGVAMLSSGVAFSPLSLFALGEAGAWYDPSDLTTLYQDAAGTTPVTAVEQPVGLVLDKSKGLVLGSELVTNGGFATDSDWTKGSNWAISGGTASKASGAGGNLTQTINTVAGRWYRVTLDVSNLSGSMQIQVAGSTVVSLQSGAFSLTLLAAVTSGTISILGGTFGVATIDNISVRELPGNHLSQSTAAARPVLSARVNLLTYTEQFDNAVWRKQNVSITANTTATTDPLGGNTADVLSETAVTNFHFLELQTALPLAATQYTFTACLKQGSSRYGGIHINDGTARGCSIDLQTGTLGTPYGSATATVADVGNGWYRLTVTATASATASGQVAIYVSNSNSLASYAGNTNNNIYIWGADLRPANAGVGLPAYQRVGAATSGSSTAAGNADYDWQSFPLYVRFDGTDDFLQSSTITPGSVDKAQVFAGVRKLSDVAYQAIAELSANTTTNNGSFILLSTSGAGVAVANAVSFGLRGATNAGYDATTFAAPSTNVLATSYDIAGAAVDSEIFVRVNGSIPTLTSTGAANAGTGNFGSYPLYVGSRGGTTLRFNGHLYQLLVRFSATNLDAATITATETWVNQRTKAF